MSRNTDIQVAWDKIIWWITKYLKLIDSQFLFPDSEDSAKKIIVGATPLKFLGARAPLGLASVKKNCETHYSRRR